MNKKQRVVVLMSGGVDSSVAAALLVEAGFDVIGCYILVWNGNPDFPCPWEAEQRDAEAVAGQLGIPLHTVNLSAQYERDVIADFTAQYQAGNTPNPDVLCNSQIKFKALVEAVRQFEPDFIATGHYARILTGSGQPQLAKGVDSNKDQSYFLWAIDRQILPKLLFPIGEYTKPQIRAMAAKFNLPTATKKDSQGICFLGSVQVRSFLAKALKTVPGEAILADGRPVATHQGVQLYTIGQRLGADQVAWSGDAPPLYVVAKDLATNRLIVGSDEQTYTEELEADRLNWLGGPPKATTFVASVKIRYRQKDVSATIALQPDGRAKIRCSEPVRAITPGQSVVLYDGDVLLGGGIIR
jgi:tRNA-specific 2-thiouridylase